MKEHESTYTLAEAAYRLRVPEPEALRLIAAMGIKTVDAGKELRFPRQQIDQLATAQAVQTARRRALDDAEAAAERSKAKHDDDDPTGSNSSIFDWLPKA